MGSLIFCHRFDGFNDLHVACTPTKISHNRLLDLLLRRFWDPVEKRLGRQDHTGRAKSTLDSPLFHERLLKRVKVATSLKQAFDGQNVSPLHLGCQDQARAGRPQVEPLLPLPPQAQGAGGIHLSIPLEVFDGPGKFLLLQFLLPAARRVNDHVVIELTVDDISGTGDERQVG